MAGLLLLLASTTSAADLSDPAFVKARDAAEKIEMRVFGRKPETRLLLGLSTEGACVYAFRAAHDEPIEKIYLEVFGETGRALVAFYYAQEGGLIYSIKTEYRYDGHIIETLSGRRLVETVSVVPRRYACKKIMRRSVGGDRISQLQAGPKGPAVISDPANV